MDYWLLIYLLFWTLASFLIIRRVSGFLDRFLSIIAALLPPIIIYVLVFETIDLIADEK